MTTSADPGPVEAEAAVVVLPDPELESDPEPEAVPSPVPEAPVVVLPDPRPPPPQSGPLPVVETHDPVVHEHVPSPRPTPIDLVARRMAEAPEAAARLVVFLLGGLGLVVVLLSTATAALVVSTPEPTPPPVVVVTGPTRVGLVHDTGPGGLSQRTRPSVAGDSLPPVPDGGRVQVQCAQTGQLVTDTGRGVSRSSDVWFRTVQGRFASSLYVDLGEPPTLTNCVAGQPDLDLPSARPPG